MDADYEAIVIGGSAAGLSGAIVLARSRRSVLVVDGGHPRNASAGHVHNFLTRDGASPAEIYATGRAELAGYGGEFVSAQVRSLARAGDAFAVELDARSLTARRLLVATGSWDELPDVPGLAARWGIDVLHCPYCHGWEVRDRRIGILATSAAAIHQAMLFGQLSTDVTVLQHTAEWSAEQAAELARLGVPVVPGRVVEVEAG